MRERKYRLTLKALPADLINARDFMREIDLLSMDSNIQFQPFVFEFKTTTEWDKKVLDTLKQVLEKGGWEYQDHILEEIIIP